MKNIKKYNERITKYNERITKNNEGITKNWNDYCDKLEDYCRRRQTKNRIAAIRKTIKYVKTGEADKDLALLLNHPTRISKKSSR
jgi:hypothetical protein